MIPAALRYAFALSIREFISLMLVLPLLVHL